MNNRYRIIDYSILGIPSIEVYGDQFDYLDLFELVGREQFMTTFNLKEGSEAYNRFGESVIGVVYYEPKTLKKLSENETEEIDLKVVKIDSPDIDQCADLRGDLRYKGISVANIASISFLPYRKQSEVYDTGEKRVPNVIEIETDCSDIDPDRLCQSYLVTKNNQDVELTDFEKEQLVGITLGLNDGHIDSRILKHFGFDKESVTDNVNVWYHLYKVKERRGTLSQDERQKYHEIQLVRNISTVKKLLDELKKSGVDANELSKKDDILKTITDSAMSFRPSILVHGKKQVYWNVDSYLHIVMRHVKEFQLGNFREKTPFPYKVQDLEMLIEKVIGRVGSEYQAHRLERPDSDFSRHGAMAVRFNDDFYHIRIEPDGRLSQFHAVCPRQELPNR